MSADYDDTRVYIVIWPEQQIIKVGYTKRPSRLRLFTSRGAVVWALIGFPTIKLAMAYEATVLAYLLSVTRPAFRHYQESRSLLGASGIGWSECYSYAPSMLRAMPRAFGGHSYRGPELGYGQECLTLSTDGRTDGLTHDNSTEIDFSPNASRANRQEIYSSLTNLIADLFPDLAQTEQRGTA